MYEVSTEQYEATADVQDYVSTCRNAGRFMQYCRECLNYGRRYGCPPFDFNPTDIICRYRNIWIYGTKIMPLEQGLPLSASMPIMEPVVAQMNRRLLEEEKRLDGFACGFAGRCPYCKTTCARIGGQPCRHPDKVRPSLESMGFDVGKTSSQYLHVDIRWGHDGLLPEYLMLVGGVFFTPHS